MRYPPLLRVFPCSPSPCPHWAVSPGASRDHEDVLCRGRSPQAGVWRRGRQKAGGVGQVGLLPLVHSRGWNHLDPFQSSQGVSHPPRYDACRRSLQAQLLKNQMSINEVPPDSVSFNGLHTRLQEIQVLHWSELTQEPVLPVLMVGLFPPPPPPQFLRQETEALWSEYANQCSQLGGSSDVEQEKVGLQEQWSSQQSSLQRRGSSLGAALRQIDSTRNHLVDFSERLERYLRQPKDVAGFTLASSSILTDIKVSLTGTVHVHALGRKRLEGSRVASWGGGLSTRVCWTPSCCPTPSFRFRFLICG